MTTISHFAEKHPDKPAIIYADSKFGDPQQIETYGELEERSRRIGIVFRRLGLEHGDNVAILMANDDEFMDVFWAAHRTGLYFTPLNWHVKADEVEYILDNSDARVLIAHARFADVATAAYAGNSNLLKCISVGGEIPGFSTLEEELDAIAPDALLGEEFEGTLMLYSSGTTGRPKGVRAPLPKVAAGEPAQVAVAVNLTRMFDMREDDVFFSPAPLYHAAPLRLVSAQQRIGATSVVMRRFDAEDSLRLIDLHRVTTSQWVPTHFRRLTRLPEATKRAYGLESLRLALHAAAPCPIPLKEEMIDWWGDAIVEFYAGTEGGGTAISAADWNEHKGSVGRHWAGGTIHILDEEGNALTEPNQEGGVYFEAPADEAMRFRYHKAEEKTAESYRGSLFTLGDVGYLDEDGFLYLTDRQSHMIISGGVNIFPQEVENHLTMHPAVEDVAVIGVPNEDLGEEVRAVVVARSDAKAGPELAQELIAYCRDGISHYKCPRSVDFVDELPRTETGKMAKTSLRDRYWKDAPATSSSKSTDDR